MQSGWRVAGSWLLIMLSFAGSAQARGRGMTEAEAREAGVSVEVLNLSVGVLSPDVGRAKFTADGMRGGVPTTFALKGDAFGYGRPILKEVRIGWLNIRFKDYGLIGMQLGGMWGSIDGRDADAARAVGASPSIFGLSGGLRLGFAYTKSFFDLRVVGDVGVRSLFVNLDGYDTQICHGKGGARPCQPSATATQGYFQPRVYLGVNLGANVTVGGYGGLDISDGVGWLAGGWIGLHIAPWSYKSPAGVRSEAL